MESQEDMFSEHEHLKMTNQRRGSLSIFFNDKMKTEASVCVQRTRTRHFSFSEVDNPVSPRLPHPEPVTPSHSIPCAPCHTALNSNILRLYLAHIAFFSSVVDSSCSSASDVDCASGDENAKERRCARHKTKFDADIDRRLRQRQHSPVKNRPPTSWDSYPGGRAPKLDFSKVYLQSRSTTADSSRRSPQPVSPDLSTIPIAPTKNGKPDKSGDTSQFFSLPDYVVEERRKKREENVMSPVSF